MSRHILTVCALLGLFSHAVCAQTQERVTIGKDAFAFHEEIFHDLNISIESPDVSDAEVFIQLIGIQNWPKINELQLTIRKSPDLNNAAALFYNGQRTIVYDPVWAANEKPEFILILGHEAGHHFCGHTLPGFSGSRWDAELQADQFGGASIKRFEAYHNRPFYDAVLAAAASKYPEQGSPLYPPRAMRLEALRKGYQEGSPCGELSPVTQGGIGHSMGTLNNSGSLKPCFPVVQTGPTSYKCGR